jgi:hypothetical protein
MIDTSSLIGNGIADDGPAINRLLEQHPGERMYLRKTTPSATPLAPSYFSSVPILLKSPGSILQGDGGGYQGGTIIQFAEGIPAGIWLQAPSCSVRDLVGFGKEPWRGAWYFDGILPRGFGGISEADGIRISAGYAHISDVVMQYFGRHGVNASSADVGGWSDDSIFERLFLGNNRGHGFNIDGGDSNCCTWDTCVYYVNQLWGKRSASFLAARHGSDQATGNYQDSCDLVIAPIQPIASCIRRSNIVTLTWKSAYLDQTLQVGGAIHIEDTSDPSFSGTFRIKAIPNSASVVYYQYGPNGGCDGGIGRSAVLPPDGSVAASRLSQVSTLRFSVPYVPPEAGVGFKVGQGVTIWQCSDPSFIGTFVVSEVVDDTTIKFVQPLQDTKTFFLGTARMALPCETWKATGVRGGAFSAPNQISRQEWHNPYAEGGQAIEMSSSNLIHAPVWSDPPNYSNGLPGIIYGSTPGIGSLGTNQPMSTVWSLDEAAWLFQRFGKTIPQALWTCYQHPVTLQTIWKQILSASEFSVWSKDPTASIKARQRLSITSGGLSTLNSEGGKAVQINVDPGSGEGGLLVGNGHNQNVLEATSTGLKPPYVAEVNARSGTIFISTSGQFKGRLCCKSLDGTVRALD